MLRVVSAHTWHFPSIFPAAVLLLLLCQWWLSCLTTCLYSAGSCRVDGDNTRASIGSRIRRPDIQWRFRVSRGVACEFGMEWLNNKESNEKEWNRRRKSALSSSQSSAECVVPNSPKITVDLTLLAICKVCSERVFAVIKSYNEVINSTNNDIDFFWLLCHWIICPAITSSHHRPYIAELRLC